MTGFTLNWWQSILMGLVIFGLGFGTRTYTYKCPQQSVVHTKGKPDTVWIKSPTISGHSTTTSHYRPQVLKPHSVLTGAEEPKDTLVSTPTDTGYHFDVPLDISMFEKTTDSTLIDGTHVTFRSRIYVFSKDSAEITHEWAVTPVPLATVHATDTLSTPVVPPISLGQTFLTKPEFTYPAGIIIGIVGTLLLHK